MRFIAAGTLATAQSMSACPAQAAPATSSRVLTSNQMFGLAEAAERTGDSALTEATYRALTKDPALEVRNEARFRLAGVLSRKLRFADSALLLRQILDEQPGAQRVRLELAQVLDVMGDESSARRVLREAQAGGLPPDVVRFVDRYSAALRARKPFGASVDFAIAPDSNINRATRNETLGTVFGDFTLDEDARQRSGIGLSVRGQSYGRLRLSDRTTLLARVSGSADLYRRSDFNDMVIGLSVGPEVTLGRDRATLEAGLVRRIFGGKLLSTTTALGATIVHPLNGVSQLRAAASIGRVAHRRNPLQSGRIYAATIGYERALAATRGLGISLSLDRQSLRDDGYSTKGAHGTIFAYQELGATTLVASFGHSRLTADDRLFPYTKRRQDRLNRFSLGATFRRFAVGGFAPFVRFTRELNRSSIELFDYRRIRTETGVTRAF
jgi:hypothetical protein